MKSYDLQPTWDNLLQTFSNDTIGRNQDIAYFINIINAIEDGCTISLDGNWGSGKTFFVKQVKMVLDAYNENIQLMKPSDRQIIQNAFARYYAEEPVFPPQVCVYYDAWENDNDSDPVLSLVYQILKNANTDFSFKNTSCIDIAASILDFFNGKNWSQLINSFKGENPLAPLEQAKNVEQLITEFLESLLPEKGNRLVIFIDELDRCKPDYAVALLERIKHYFSNDKITFVLSVNTSELQHTIKKHYGNDFDSSRYLDRFFDLRVTLPPANIQKFYNSLNFNSTHYTFDIVSAAVIDAFHFELREIAKYLRLLKVAASKPAYAHYSYLMGESLQFSICYIIPIMIGLKISDIQRYNAFIAGNDYTPLLEISGALSPRFFTDLLNRGETFDATDSSETVVSIDDKLKAVYEAIFSNTYNQQNCYTKIGEMRFSDGTKETLRRIDSLLSQYTNVT